MMLLYFQETGNLYNNHEKIASCYSGKGEGKNNPSMQNVHNVGPIPCGHYTIQPPIDSPDHGPFAMHLLPNPTNEMFKRSAFMIHGDSVAHPGEASEGCIITSRVSRQAIWNSGIRALYVQQSEGKCSDLASSNTP